PVRRRSTRAGFPGSPASSASTGNTSGDLWHQAWLRTPITPAQTAWPRAWTASFLIHVLTSTSREAQTLLRPGKRVAAGTFQAGNPGPGTSGPAGLQSRYQQRVEAGEEFCVK